MYSISEFAGLLAVEDVLLSPQAANVVQTSASARTKARILLRFMMIPPELIFRKVNSL